MAYIVYAIFKVFIYDKTFLILYFHIFWKILPKICKFTWSNKAGKERSLKTINRTILKKRTQILREIKNKTKFDY